MESELSDIFWVKLSRQKCKLLSPRGTQSRAASAVFCLFLKKHTNMLNQTVKI